MHKNNAVNLSTNKVKMRQRLIFFLVVLLLIFQGEIFGQKKPYDFGFSRKHLLFINSDFGINLPANDQIQPKDTAIKPARRDILYASISGSYYTDHLGIICKAELQLQKKTSVAIRLRLGSLDYVNWMEQKPNAIRPR
ncbi:MAG: hypothetical protein JNM19_19390 [Chitinophagaceae bacterium]|nr:hypothetical protein [Chitinophagaceae bacterium]